VPFHAKSIIVTGASSGIGRELALQFADQGALLTLAARDEARLDAVAAECIGRGAQVLVVRTDVTIEADCRALIERTMHRFGRIDVLVNNAGLGASSLFEQITDLSVFDAVMRVNLYGSVYCTHAALPHLRQSGGVVVGIASLAGLTGVPKRCVYAASKHAMAGFFDSLRIELHGTGVAVTMIYPGYVFSEINQRALDRSGQPFGERAYKRLPRDTMPTGECARQILRAIARRDRQLVMTARGRAGVFIRAIAPALVDRIARRVASGKQ
jgi:NAD(P)-dependent dehydrogenase (short-subunit alcohol dehydrogenase family)